ncbi:MAG: 5-oxoprolinase subunit PxpB [Thalassotalea sp.]|nr:5-oxoprolinase subunit PxpB [Thalassotalea sp.]
MSQKIMSSKLTPSKNVSSIEVRSKESTTGTFEALIEIAGEDALIVYLKQPSLVASSNKIAALRTRVIADLGSKVVDTIPSYQSLLVIFDVFKTDHFEVKKNIRKHLTGLVPNDVNTHATSDESTDVSSKRAIELPVFYSAKSGPDLHELATHAQLSVEDVIALHQAQIYQVFALGFAPGFAFLGEVDERIAKARLSTPRKQVPKGAVGIADRQTAVYPAASPGGWNLIGLCPTPLFDPENEPHVPFQVGDSVKFYSIDENEFIAMGGSFEY